MSIRDEINQAAFDESVRIRRKALALTPRRYAPGGPVHRNTATGESFIPLATDILLSSTIRTAETGARVEIGPFGIASYDAENKPCRPWYAEGGPALPVLSGCAHQQAEPVILSTDETVACVCIACLAPLSADWITNQRDKAEREAHCDHEREYEDRRLGYLPRLQCFGCGRVREGQ